MEEEKEWKGRKGRVYEGTTVRPPMHMFFLQQLDPSLCEGLHLRLWPWHTNQRRRGSKIPVHAHQIKVALPETCINAVILALMKYVWSSIQNTQNYYQQFRGRLNMQKYTDMRTTRSTKNSWSAGDFWVTQLLPEPGISHPIVLRELLHC
ncbi:hypothetical protein PoB_000754200 [Plakobranchus ocellatus]|uniref:Uncharacterized protein n=1 Tax=Plakobranchus ocellatus TaxID=259542 RepID=A0AAV3YFQ0_9GAST|nr:hypothetical protein PoB_000754200 [Plakobranchus ocellatus]